MDVRTSANSRKRKSADVTLDRVEIPQSNISAEVYPPYDMSLPENWSVQKLKSELRQLGISPGLQQKNDRLLILYRSATSNSRSTSSAVISTDITSNQRAA